MLGGLTVPFPVNLWLPLKTGSFLVAACLPLQLSCHLDFGFHSIIVSWPHENMAQDNKGLIQELGRENSLLDFHFYDVCSMVICFSAARNGMAD